MALISGGGDHPGVQKQKTRGEGEKKIFEFGEFAGIHLFRKMNCPSKQNFKLKKWGVYMRKKKPHINETCLQNLHLMGRITIVLHICLLRGGFHIFSLMDSPWFRKQLQKLRVSQLWTKEVCGETQRGLYHYPCVSSNVQPNCSLRWIMVDRSATHLKAEMSETHGWTSAPIESRGEPFDKSVGWFQPQTQHVNFTHSYSNQT